MASPSANARDCFTDPRKQRRIAWALVCCVVVLLVVIVPPSVILSHKKKKKQYGDPVILSLSPPGACAGGYSGTLVGELIISLHGADEGGDPWNELLRYALYTNRSSPTTPVGNSSARVAPLASVAPLPKRAWAGSAPQATQPRGAAILPDLSGMLVASARTSTSAVLWALPPRLACCAGSPSPVSACPASLPAGARETEGASLLTTQGGVSHPYGVAVSAATGLVYVSSQETGRVTEHAAYPSGAVLRTLAAFGNAAVSDDAGVRGIALLGNASSPGGERAHVALSNSDQVAVVSVWNGTVLGFISVVDPVAVVAAANGDLLIGSNTKDVPPVVLVRRWRPSFAAGATGTAGAGAVAGAFVVDYRAGGFGGHAAGIAESPDGSLVFALGQDSGALLQFDAATGALAGAVRGREENGMLFYPLLTNLARPEAMVIWPAAAPGAGGAGGGGCGPQLLASAGAGASGSQAGATPAGLCG